MGDNNSPAFVVGNYPTTVLLRNPTSHVHVRIAVIYHQWDISLLPLHPQE